MPHEDLDLPNIPGSDVPTVQASKGELDRLLAERTSNEATPDPMDDDPLVGATIGNFRVLSVLGRGGFAKVYKALDTRLDRPVALKFLHERLSEEHLLFFAREAKALAALSKDVGIVQVYAWDEFGGRNYLVLELCDTSAHALLRRNPNGLEWCTAVRIVLDCARGLARAHKLGILHRDIKPSNILLDGPEYKAQLADFGLARLYERGEMTLSGAISGSPPYMSPEQARSASMDERSDIFSLGVSLYEMLSGRLPFEGRSGSDIMEKIRENKRVPLKEKAPHLPHALLEVVERATAHAPGKRYQSADDFAEDLERLLKSSGKETLHVARERTRRRIRLAAAAVLAAALAGGLTFGLFSIPGRPAASWQVLAAAKSELDRGRATEAQRLYSDFLSTCPQDDEALYGLGYAHYLQGNPKDASVTFEKISDSSMKTDGTAAVAYSQEREKARPVLEKAKDSASTPYPKTLLAMLDIGAEHYEEASRQLADVDKSRFAFEWQRDAYFQTLGQALFHLGQYERAAEIFGNLTHSASPSRVSVANTYAEMARARGDEARRTAVAQQAAEVRRLFDAAKSDPSKADLDPWTSRPLRFFILPVQSVHSRLALESGLADVLPQMLGAALQSSTALRLVEREHIQDIVQEQHLSALLSSAPDRLRLCNLLGARLILECRFETLFNRDLLNITIVDTETTQAIPLTNLPIPSDADSQKWFAELAGKIDDAVRKAYPLRAKILPSPDGPVVNIGSAVNLRSGTEFAIVTGNEHRAVAPDKLARVSDVSGEAVARVTLEGISAAEIPQEGLFVIDKGAAENAGS